MKKRILIPRVRLNESFDDWKYAENDGELARKDKGRKIGFIEDEDDPFFKGEEDKLRKITTMQSVKDANEKDTDIEQTQDVLESYLKSKFGGVNFRVYVRLNESIRSNNEETVDFIIVPEVTDPLNVTYTIDDIDSEIQNNKVIPTLKIFNTDKVKSPEDPNRYMTLWELIISAAKAKDSNAPDYIKAIHKVS